MPNIANEQIHGSVHSSPHIPNSFSKEPFRHKIQSPYSFQEHSLRCSDALLQLTVLRNCFL